ncbi:HAD-IA family hydrolase [Rhizobium sp. SEMIA 4085]|uniref:Phosphoglycolate phosphatase protein n=1 Tax=Rhizobium gallicum bv. gallicum R602sp TaxID=1041138 RepID=A0A0B4X2K0_9HYPH|nr:MULTISPECIES: HAD-IA family hydrolase [Rhizobium]AJD41366.1 phosphoglycolate phosphatase protein [Rhizobium gallicum bv. gallicum R602sp]NNH30817.1 HAD-IA family hydrolase [Rhizobium sp. SEMIA 4085]TDW26113.1 phosphoglycolate phosphatase [Rhizobium azibense]
MKLVLFDCDGTLVDSAALIHEVMARTFVQFGHSRPDLSSTKSIIGLTLDIAIARMQGKLHVDDEAIAMTAHYKSIYMNVRQEPGMDVPLFAGIKPMIDGLAAREDILIGAVTGKSRRGLVNVLETHGFAPHFIVSRTADDCPSKPHPAMVTECCDEAGMKAADAIVIGDAVYDMQMAKAAGAKAIGVSWGYASVDDLIAAGADTVAYHPNDVLDHF